jgi:hypothetical protein
MAPLWSFCVNVLGLFIVVAPALASWAGEMAVTTGAEFSSGDYGGSDDIEEIYVPLQVRYQTSRYHLSLTVPYLEVEAPVGSTGDTRTESGLGDVIVGGSLYDVWVSPAHRYSLDVGAKVKFGTADENKALGSGENDYAASTALYRWFDRAALYAAAGYRWRGDPPAIDYDNTATASLGGFCRFARATSAGLAYDCRQAVLEEIDDPREVSVYVSHRFTPRWRARSYVFSGLSDGSADWGVGLLLEWRTLPEEP